jgi:hypothetical protein
MHVRKYHNETPVQLIYINKKAKKVLLLKVETFVPLRFHYKIEKKRKQNKTQRAGGRICKSCIWYLVHIKNSYDSKKTT